MAAENNNMIEVYSRDLRTGLAGYCKMDISQITPKSSYRGNSSQDFIGIQEANITPFTINGGYASIRATVMPNYLSGSTLQQGYDVAIFDFSDELCPGDTVGWISISGNAPAKGNYVHAIGYPNGNNPATFMHDGKGQTHSAPGVFIRYGCDTLGGNSGCPIVTDSSFEYVAIHRGAGVPNSTTGKVHHNKGVNVNRDNIKSFLYGGFKVEPGGGFEAVDPGFEYVVSAPGSGECPSEIVDED